MTTSRINEENLVDQLKTLCYVNGREKDPKESAKIFHKLGKVYKDRSPSKICLIRSAALFNAAIVRNPENVTVVKEDLEGLCSLLLQDAGAKKTNTELTSAAKTCQQAFRQLRDSTKKDLSRLEPVPETADANKLHKLEKSKIREVQRIQDDLTKGYSSIMSCLSDYCLSILGDPPSHCHFALVGMGSLARKEVTPYSDFENIIVLEEGAQVKENYCEIKEYFRWFAVIFQIILINMGETILPSVAIPTLNDYGNPDRKGDWFFDAYTPSGVSFDGLMPHACKCPLGRQYSVKTRDRTTELIKPASEMASYLDNEQELKNGFHLADVLSKTCFVSGDRKVYEDFLSRVAVKLASRRKDKTRFANEIRKQISDDKLKFDVNENCSNMYTTSKFNLKRVIYRSTTVFIAALATIHGILESSCFDILDALHEKEVISAIEKHFLHYAVAIACEVRLKIYMRRQKQSDVIEDRAGLGKQLSELLHAVGGKSVVDYFTIARGFQKAMSLIDFENLDKPLRLNISIDYKYSVDICCKLRLHDTCVQVCSAMLSNKGLSSADEAACHYYTGISLLDLQKPREAEKHFDKELCIRSKLPRDKCDELIADCLYNLGRCYIMMTDYDKALKSLNQELEMRKKMSENELEDIDIAFCVREIGTCLLLMNKTDEALQKFQTALEINKRVCKDPTSDVHVIFCQSQIGACLMKEKRFDEALKKFKEELEMRKKFSSDEETDVHVAECYDRIGICLLNLEHYQDARARFRCSFSIRNRLSKTKEHNVGIASCVYNINICNDFMNDSYDNSAEAT